LSLLSALIPALQNVSSSSIQHPAILGTRSMIQSVRPHRLSHPLTVLMYQSLIIKPRGHAVGTPFACCWQTLSFRTTTTTITTTTSTTDATNTTRPRHGDSWNSKLKELEQFVKTNGHACVPQSHNTLGWWVHANRKEYKKFQSHTRPCWMTAERIQHLENAGFIWNVDKEKWMDGYEKLCHYQRQHGHWYVLATVANILVSNLFFFHH
jgi:hypothetical protein